MRASGKNQSRGWCGFCSSEVHGAPRNDGGDGMLVHHLRHCTPEQHHVLVKRLDLPLQLDTVHEVNRNRHMFTTQSIQERVLKRRAFWVVGLWFLWVAHDELLLVCESARQNAIATIYTIIIYTLCQWYLGVKK